MNPPHVNKMCQNKPWTDLDLNLGRPEHIKRTCDGSIPSNARIRFMLLENSDRNITVLEKSTSNKMSNKIIKKPSWFCTHLFQGVWGQGAGPGPRHKTTQPGSPRMEEEPGLPSRGRHYGHLRQHMNFTRPVGLERGGHSKSMHGRLNYGARRAPAIEIQP